MSSVPRELRLAVRTLRRSPVYSIAAISTLGLGISALTLAYAFVNAFFFRPLPFRADHELVGISSTHRAATGEVLDFAVSPTDYAAFAERNRTLAGAAAIRSQTYAVQRGETPESIRGAAVSASMWRVLGVGAMAGRTFTESEDRPGEPIVVISARLQARLFAGPVAGAIGQRLLIDGQPRTVIGVMPPEFRPRMNPGELWLPLGASAATGNAALSRQLQVVGRMRAGVAIPQVRDDIGRIARELEAEHGASHREWGASVKDLRAKIGDSARAVTVTLLAAVAFLLLLTCANTGNLAIARVARRRREISTRLALGAPMRTLVRHQLVEALLIALGGGAAGVLLAVVALPPALRLLTSDNPLLPLVAVDWRVVLVALVVSVTAGTLCSAVPALVGVRVIVRHALGGGGRHVYGGVRDTRLRRLLMSLQVAAASVLLVGSLSAVVALRALGDADVGYDPRNVVVGSLTLPVSRYANLHDRTRFAAQVLERLRATPGIRRAGLTTGRFLRDDNVQGIFSIQGSDGGTGIEAAGMAAELRRIDGDYFAALRIPLLEGRGFTAADRDSAPPVAIVNRAFVRQYLGDRSPLGVRIRRGSNPWTTIVGVVPDVRDGGMSEEAGATVYLRYAQSASAGVSFVIETTLRPREGERALRAAIGATDPGQPFDRVAPLSALMSESVGEERFKMLLLVVLAGLATLVACVGIYGVTAYLVQQRTREVAIRLALGAGRAAIVRRFLVDTARWVVGAATAGIILAWTASGSLGARFPEAAHAGPAVYAVVGLVLVAVGALASTIPTIRASRIPPAEVLRGE
jgi:predicted permease